jgi:hypothetical protein
MQDYLRSVWAMLTAFKEDTIPLLSSHNDLEAHGQGTSDSIEVVCESPHVPVPAHFERVSPFSEYHFPLRPFVFTSEA